MGLIKDAIGSALGAGDVKNGFNGPNMPFLPRQNPGARNQRNDWNQSFPIDQPATSRPLHSAHLSSNPLYPAAVSDFDAGPIGRDDNIMYESQVTGSMHAPYANGNGPENYARDRYTGTWQQGGSSDQTRRYDATSPFQQPLPSSPSGYFKPLVLPQIDYGDGKPFLRAYSDDLNGLGIPAEAFFEHLDAINAAIIPSPENQIFQKAAGIAGWFVPGAASIGLLAGQVVVGLGAAFGHASLVNRALSSANLALFLPNGLEICIGRASDVDNLVGVSSRAFPQQSTQVGSPLSRLSPYENATAPLSIILEPSQQHKRNDVVAILGRGIASRGDQKKAEHARKDLAEGKNKKSDALERDLKWLMVKRATPNALQHWQATLRQSNAAIEQERGASSQAMT